MARQQQAQRIAAQQRQSQAVQQQQNARRAANQAANQQRGGAMATDPQTTEAAKAAFDPARAQRRVDYLKKNRPNDPEIKTLTRRIAKAGGVPAPGPAAPTPESVTQEGFMGAGEAYQDITQQFRDFDPMQMQQQYEQVYSQEMDRARQNVMGQFERRNAEEFARQQEDVQRQIVERGLDPNSPAAQGLYKQLNVRQDLARQEALSAAEQAAQGIQQQMFGQAGQIAMMPYEQWQAIQQPYIAGIGAQYSQQQLTQQQQFEAQQARLNRQAQERIARMSRGGGGGGQAGPSLYERMEAQALAQGYGQGQQQINPWATAAQGAAQGFGMALGAGLAKG